MGRMAPYFLRMIASALLLVFFSTPPLCLAQPEKAASTTPPPVSTGEPEEKPAPKVSSQTQKVDAAGQELGKKIDRLGDAAAGRLGSWVNAKILAGITWLKLIVSFLLLLMVAITERFVRALIDRHRKGAPEDILAYSVKDHVVESIGKPLSLFIWVYGAYGAVTPLLVHFRSPDGTNLVYVVAQRAADLGAAVALIWFIYRLVAIVDSRLKKWAATTDSTIDDMLAPLLGKSLRIFIVIIGAILVIQNLTGIKIGPLLASLGVGGIAVALAAKDSIANFFGTLTILFDKPFQVGQRIVIDSTDGTVESVGFRSTRIRTLTGHLVTIPNEKLVNTSIENIGQRPHIRWLNNITITYDTPPEKVEKAVAILREALDNHEGMHPDFPPRVYFNGFNDWSLNILMVAWYHPADYWNMQEWQQKACLEILKRFNEEGIDFAFPSQTVYLANDDARQLKLQMLKGEVETYSPEKAE